MYYLQKQTATGLLFVLVSLNTDAGWFDDTFIDPADGQFDTSNWLLNKKGFLPVPIVITEPAIGYGGGIALAYFHDKLGSDENKKPSISALALGATENGTWFAGGGYLGIWKDDRVRYKGGGGLAHVKMDYYGVGDRLETGIEFETDALFLMQELQFRLGDSSFFAGASYTFVDTGNTFNLKFEEPLEKLPGAKFDSRTAALGLILGYDSLNNMLTPTAGTQAQIKLQIYDQALGGDDDFRKYGGFIKHYSRLNEQWMLGLRADVKAIDGDAPFYSYPFLQMRGIKVMRYQGEKTFLGEAQINWNINRRWTLLGFAGLGKALGINSEKDSDLIVSRGIGIRYLIASKLGLKVGIDIARGPEDTAFYIIAGNAWSL
jgi:hypothetical protein